MNPTADDNIGGATPPEQAAPAEQAGGPALPWPRTWRGVYWVVAASFAVWLGMLLALTRLFT